MADRRFTVTLEDALYDDLASRARASRRSLSAEAATAVEHYLRQQDAVERYLRPEQEAE